MSLVNCILQLTESKGYVEKIYSIPLAAQNDDWIHVYDMYDEEDEVATYHAIVRCKTLPNSSRVSCVYFCRFCPRGVAWVGRYVANRYQYIKP